jgi:hypothetical protein
VIFGENRFKALRGKELKNAKKIWRRNADKSLQACSHPIRDRFTCFRGLSRPFRGPSGGLDFCVSINEPAAVILRHLVKSNSIKTWPFDQPRNCATITMRQVLDGSEPILLVSHDADDHAWQFIGTTDASVPDGRVVCLEEMVRLDPTVLEVADLPPGWQAIRDKAGGHWSRRLHPPDFEDAPADIK